MLGSIDDAVVTEYLIEQIQAKSLEDRIQAAQSLARHDPERVPPQAFAPLLGADQWPARAVAVECLARIGGRESLQMLIEHMPNETGRQRIELTTTLERMTGESFGNSPRAWWDWWQEHQESFQPRRLLIRAPVRPKTKDARYFALQLDSLRVVFVLDISQTNVRLAGRS